MNYQDHGWRIPRQLFSTHVCADEQCSFNDTQFIIHVYKDGRYAIIESHFVLSKPKNKENEWAQHLYGLKKYQTAYESFLLVSIKQISLREIVSLFSMGELDLQCMSLLLYNTSSVW